MVVRLQRHAAEKHGEIGVGSTASGNHRHPLLPAGYRRPGIFLARYHLHFYFQTQLEHV